MAKDLEMTDASKSAEKDDKAVEEKVPVKVEPPKLTPREALATGMLPRSHQSFHF